MAKNRIKELRVKNGLSQKELASKIDASNQIISFYENGKREPKIEMWQKLADFFNVPVPYLQGLTISTTFVLKIINDAYYSYLKYPKTNELIENIKTHLQLLDFEEPSKVISLKNMKEFDGKAQKYWDDQFNFIFLTGRFTYMLDKSVNEKERNIEEYKSFIAWAIKDVDDAITETSISDSFESIVGGILPWHDSQASELLKFGSKSEIIEYINEIQVGLFIFKDSLDKLPDNKEQHTPQQMRKRFEEWKQDKQKNDLWTF